MTLEQQQYGPGWLKCVVCGLVGPKVLKREGSAARCESSKTCELVKAGSSFGGKVLGPSKPAVPELDGDDLEAIDQAMIRFRVMHPEEVQERAAQLPSGKVIAVPVIDELCKGCWCPTTACRCTDEAGR